MIRIHLSEMAIKRADVIATCISLGRQFVAHFLKVIEEGEDSQDFKHHCHEMQVWWDNVKNIRFKGNNKVISVTDLEDWFFTAGQSYEDLVPSSRLDSYKEFVSELLKNRDQKVEDLLKRVRKS